MKIVHVASIEVFFAFMPKISEPKGKLIIRRNNKISRKDTTRARVPTRRSIPVGTRIQRGSVISIHKITEGSI